MNEVLQDPATGGTMIGGTMMVTLGVFAVLVIFAAGMWFIRHSMKTNRRFRFFQFARKDKTLDGRDS